MDEKIILHYFPGKTIIFNYFEKSFDNVAAWCIF